MRRPVVRIDMCSVVVAASSRMSISSSCELKTFLFSQSFVKLLDALVPSMKHENGFLRQRSMYYI